MLDLCWLKHPYAAMASSNKKPCGNVRLLPLATLAPHPNPPCKQGRAHITTSVGIHASFSAIALCPGFLMQGLEMRRRAVERTEFVEPWAG